VASGRDDRRDDKDAADVFRLMQTTSPADVGSTLARLSNHPVAGPPSINAVAYLVELFGRRGATGIEMAARALQLAVPESRIEMLCVS
jgi:hypothetical protein